MVSGRLFVLSSSQNVFIFALDLRIYMINIIFLKINPLSRFTKQMISKAHSRSLSEKLCLPIGSQSFLTSQTPCSFRLEIIAVLLNGPRLNFQERLNK